MRYVPREYQPVVTDHILDHPRCAVWLPMGMGKSSATLTALDALIPVGDISLDRPALVLAPYRVAKTTWPEEAQKWDHLTDFNIVPILGDEGERRAMLRQREMIYSINYENLPWLTEELERQGKEWPFRTVIADEGTRLKGFRLGQGRKRARALGKIAHRFCDRFIELSGTPAPNGLQDLWGQMWFLDQGQRLGRTFDSFKQRWFQRSHSGYGIDPLPFAQAQIQDRLNDICLSLKAEDYFDLQEPIVNIVTVDLPERARKIYRDMEKEMFAEIEGHGVEAFNAAGRTNKCLQLCNGAAYVGAEAKEWKVVHDEKIQALDSIIEEAAGAPVLVAYNFRSDLERLRKAFPAGRVLDKDAGTIRDWNAGKIPVLFAHPASAGHGLNLQHGGNILAFFGVNWNLEEHDQIIERIGPVRQLQAGYNRPVFIHYILARKTVDFMVRERLIGKRRVQDILLDAVRQFRREG